MKVDTASQRTYIKHNFLLEFLARFKKANSDQSTEEIGAKEQDIFKKFGSFQDEFDLIVDAMY